MEVVVKAMVEVEFQLIFRVGGGRVGGEWVVGQNKINTNLNFS